MYPAQCLLASEIQARDRQVPDEHYAAMEVDGKTGLTRAWSPANREQKAKAASPPSPMTSQPISPVSKPITAKLQRRRPATVRP